MDEEALPTYSRGGRSRVRLPRTPPPQSSTTIASRVMWPHAGVAGGGRIRVDAAPDPRRDHPHRPGGRGPGHNRGGGHTGGRRTPFAGVSAS